MRRAILLAAVALPAASILPCADRQARTDEFRQTMRAALAGVEAELAKPNPTPTTRDLPNAALAKLILGGSPREAEKLILKAFSYQDMDPSSPGHGTIPWRVGHPEIKDANSIEFCMQPIGPILIHYGRQLTPEFRRQVMPHIRAAFEGIRRHKVPVTYTNIFLMKTVNLILAGEAIGDEKAAGEGYAMLDRWMEHTREAGIGEFDSPNYYAVDLNSLLMAYRYAARADAREKFRRILDLFWSDIAANFFAGRGTLSGPHSRGYEFLTGHENVEWYLYHEGLRQMRPSMEPPIGRIYLLENESAGGYHPPPEILRLASIRERVVLSRWRNEPGKDRYNYITPDFAIGSASTHYGTHDKLINIELAAGRDLPVIFLSPDTTDHPYGLLRSPDRSGHGKPVHLPLNALSVQEKGALLVLLDLDATATPETASLATNVVLPAPADRITLDGRTVSISGEFEHPARIDSVAGVRAGTAGVAFRVFAASGAGGQLPGFVFKGDRAGLEHGAARFAVYHYRGAPKKLADAHVRAGILFLAERCAGDGALGVLVERVRRAEITQSADGAVWEVKARLGGMLLEGARDAVTRQILKRRVNGRDLESFVLKVNDQDIATALLGAAGR